MLTELEQKILEIVSQRLLVRRSELAALSSKEDGPNGALAAAKSLADKGLLQAVTPLGETSFTITQKGMRFSRGKI